MKKFAWKTALLDACMWMPSLLAALLIRRDLASLTINLISPYWLLPVVTVMILQVVLGLAFGIYVRRGRANNHLARTNLLLVMVVTLLAGTGGALISRIPHWRPSLPSGVPFLAGLIAVCLIFSLRGAELYIGQLRSQNRKPVIVYGATDLGRRLIGQMVEAKDSGFIVRAIIDDDPARRGGFLHGLRVKGGLEDLRILSEKTGANVLLVADTELSEWTLDRIRSAAHETKMRVLVIPSIECLYRLSLANLDDIDVSKFMEREQVQLNDEGIRGLLKGKRVLVTGAGGSIGSELCRQVQRFQPDKLYMLDRDEGGLHATQLSLTSRALLDDDTVVLADLRDRQRICDIFDELKPDVVFHAAALKHQPLLELYPTEAWKTNVQGTENVLVAAQAAGVGVVVNISTDKAANPCCVLGDSKRIAERLTAARAQGNAPGKWVSVRFGNVLGSRGSVIRTFVEQIRRNAELTVTDPHVERYFMTIPEAAQLVLQAALVGQSGETLVLNMGDPVRIADLAKGLLTVAGRSDLDIVYTGLRPGEKMSEELFDDREVVASNNRHPLISQVRVEPLSHMPDTDDPRATMKFYARSQQGQE